MKLQMILLSFVIAAQAHAETVLVLPATGINVPAPILEATADVLRDHLEETGRFQAVLEGADLTVAVHITRLGSSAQVRLTACPAAGGGCYVDTMPAASPDDLDRVLTRLARGLADGKRGKEAGDIETVTAAEATPLLKRSSTHVFGVSLGLAVPMGSSSSDALPGLGVFWFYDASSFFADVTLQLHAKEEQGDVSVGIGAYLPLGHGDLTPYVGGGARYAHTHYDSEGAGASGLQLYAALGGLEGRSSSVQLRGQIELFVDTFSQSTASGSMVGGGLAFTFGIGF